MQSFLKRNKKHVWPVIALISVYLHLIADEQDPYRVILEKRNIRRQPIPCVALV